MSWFEASARWYGVLVLVTWGWAPLVRLLCPRLASRGMLIARPLALLGVVYPLWLVAGLGLLPYSTGGLWVTLGVGAIVAWGVGLRLGVVERGWLRSLLVAEGISLVAFGSYVWLRGFTPEIMNTEKPMDSAFLASSALTSVIPPPDPWFAGEPINYYYLGYLLHGALARLAGVVPTTGFNLALATTFAAAATAAAGFGYDAARPWQARRRAIAAGGLATALLALAGNLIGAWRLLRAPGETIAAGWWQGIGWRASRIVCDAPRVGDACPGSAMTINEFPFFSFLLGDLHPHLMALPFTVVALALALNLLLIARGTVRPGRSEWVRVGVTGAVVGSLYALNSWDLPTFLLVAAVALWLGWEPLVGTGKAGRGVAVLVGAAVVAWLPFYARYVPPDGLGPEALPDVLRGLPVLPGLLASLGVHLGERTSVGEYLTNFGVPYLFAVWLIAGGWLGKRAEGEPGAPTASPPVVVGALSALAAAVLLAAPVVLLCGLPLVGAVLLLGRGGRRGLSPRGVALALFALGFALSITVELFYLRDLFDSRMNTLFKVYYQVWTLFALGSALAMVAIWQEARPRWAARPALAAVGTAALAAVAVYPVVAGASWTDRFSDWEGLDGIAYLERRAPGEGAAIRWLQERAAPGEVVLEAAGCSYQVNGDVPINRVSAFTGVSAPIGWGRSHEIQWRDGQPDLLAEIDARGEDVRRLFSEPRGELLERYGVDWLFVGRYETEEWGGACATAGPYEGVEEAGYPGEGWELAFEEGEARVYRRVSEG